MGLNKRYAEFERYRMTKSGPWDWTDRTRGNHTNFNDTIEDRISERVRLGLNEACSSEIKYFI